MPIRPSTTILAATLVLVVPTALSVGDVKLMTLGPGDATAFRDAFSANPSTSGLWTVHRATPDAANEASWDANAGTLYLTRATHSRAAAIFAQYSLRALKWEAEFDYRVGGGTGADGFIFLFYKDRAPYASSPPEAGRAMGFSTLASPAVGGYGIEFDSYYDTDSNVFDPQTNHVALIEEAVQNHYAIAASNVIEDNAWHHAKVAYDNADLKVWLDGSLVLTDTLRPARTTYDGIGFSAATGADTNNHEIDNFVLRVY